MNVNFGDLVTVKKDSRQGEVVGVGQHGIQEPFFTVLFQDGSQEEFKAAQLDSHGPWEVPIIGDIWRVANPVQGSGLALIVHRGIPCEGHVQVLTQHDTNGASYWATKRSVERIKVRLTAQIESFVGFAKSIEDWELKDHIGLMFYRHLLKQILNENNERSES